VKLTSNVVERNGVITLAGKSMTLLGPEVKVGQKAPNFQLVEPYERVELFSSAKEAGLADSKGKVRLISVVPSLDTPVCDLQTQKFEQEAKTFPQVEFYTISMDLPFAQARYCGAKDVSHMQVLSDYRDGSFGLSYGVLIKELRLLSRAIFIIDNTDTIKYVQYVNEISLPPDYDAALAALKSLVGVSAIQTTTSTTKKTTSTLPLSTTPTVSQGNQVGNLAPDFQLSDLQGNIVTISNLKGKPILINFWATWCPYCQAERPTIQQIYNEWQSKGLVVLTIDIIGSTATETPSNLADFMQTHNYSFPVLLDMNRDATKSYGIKFTPTNILIDKNGIIYEIQTGGYPSKAAMETSLTKLLAR
jgi:thiol peroxidase